MSGHRELIENQIPELIELRHDLHAHPELGYAEHRTSQIVQEQLANFGVDFKAGLARGTGVLGFLPASANSESARTIALRADMDALPILERTQLPYASRNAGVMHACGHDGHTAILIGAARTLRQAENRPNNVLFVFQPAEEGGAGGDAMCKDGALNGTHFAKADVMYGLHGMPDAPVGTVRTRVGALMASASEIHIEIRGKGAHAAFPHKGIDPVVIASHVIVALQSIASRAVDPLESFVLTIAKIDAGFAHNVIPETASLKGTMRTLSDAMTEWGKERVNQVVHSVCEAFGASASIEWVGWYPVTVNHPEATERFRTIARQTIGEAAVNEQLVPVMGAEDFSFYGHHVPACFFFLGILPAAMETYPNLHAAEFDFNDDAIPFGVSLMTELALAG